MRLVNVEVTFTVNLMDEVTELDSICTNFARLEQLQLEFPTVKADIVNYETTNVYELENEDTEDQA